MSGKMQSRRFIAWGGRGSSIRFRIVLLAIIAIAPLLVDRVRVLEASRSEHLATANAQALNLARIGVDKQEEVLISAQSVLQTVAHAIERVQTQGPECNRMLSDVASDVPWMKAISVISPQGRFICASKLTALGLDVADRPYFQTALRKGGFVVSGFLHTRSQNTPGIVVAYGKRQADGKVEAVIGALVDLRWIGQLTSVVEQRLGTVALLVDSAGKVIAGHPYPDAWIGRDLSNYPLMRDVKARREGTIASVGFDSVRRIWSFLPVADTDAYLLVGINEHEALAKVEQEMVFAYTNLAFIVLLVLVGAWTFGERAILRPIRALARAAEMIGRGDLSVRTAGGHWAQEFLPLTRSLDSMAARLASRERSLRTETDRFRELASLDSLTGLSNRRAFDTYLAAEWQRAAGHQEALALLMIDVDHFKRYNDHYGHPEGDTCLRAIAAILADASAAGGSAARYGGEEFALLVPGLDNAEAVRLAERIRLAVEGLAVPHVEAPSGVVTISIGLASLVPDRSGRTETLMAAADAALYASKHDRNTVTAYAPVMLAEAS